MAAEVGWDTQTVLKKKSAKPTTALGLAKAQAKGDVETVKKVDVGNKKVQAPSNAQKIDAETETFRVAHVTPEFSKALMQARTAKGMSQKDLAAKIAQKPSVIQDYENGKAIPSPQIVSSLQRALGGVKLPKAAPKKQKAAADDG